MNPSYKRVEFTKLYNSAVQLVTSGVDTLVVLNNVTTNGLSLSSNLTAGNYFCTIQYKHVYKIIFYSYGFGNPGSMSNFYLTLYLNGVAVATTNSRYTAQLAIRGNYVAELKPGDQLYLRALVSGSGTTYIGDAGGYPYTVPSLNIIEII